MAELICQLHWDGTKVVKSYQVLSTGSNDIVHFSTADPVPFIIESTDAGLARQLGLAKAPDTNGANLYQVPTHAAQQRRAPGPLPAWLLLKCGTLDKDGNFEPWGGVGPDGF